MYRERLEEDGVHHLMWPRLGRDDLDDLADPLANAADADADANVDVDADVDVDAGVDATADVPSGTPCVATASQGSPSTGHSESRNKEESGGDGGGKDTDKATIAPILSSGSGVTSSSSSSLVPRGAYRRLVCVPADVSWEAAAPWDDDADESSAMGSSSASCSHVQRGAPARVADSDGGGGDSVGRIEARDPEVGRGGGAKEGESGRTAGGSAAGAALMPVLDDVRLTFTLPPGSFATMFLREVMKT